MRIVVDASVTLKWVLDEPGSDDAFALQNSELIAPALWLAEAAGALGRMVRKGEISADEAALRFAELQRAPVAPVAVEPHLAAALRLAGRIGHSVHDCLYLAVAQRHDAQVVTADWSLVVSAVRAGLGDRIRLLGT